MNYELVKKENSELTVKVTVDWSEFEKAVKEAYNKTKSRYAIQGFRKGKAPLKMIENQYGEGVFYEEAVNIILPVQYEKAIDELKIDPVARPDIDLEQIEKGQDFIFTAVITVKPDVAIEGYKGMEVEEVLVTVTDELVQTELDKMAEQNSRIVNVEDKAIENGNTALIDYMGFVGEDQFEGGTAEGHELEIGSGSFIPGFEEQLIGKKIGDDTEVKVTFPEDYQSEDLAGKEAIFKVKIHEIKAKEVPVLDDEFAKDTSEFDTIEELKTSIKTELEEAAAKNQITAQRDKAIERATQLMDVVIPQAMIDSEVEGMLKDFDRQLQSQGMSLEMYSQFTGGTLDTLKDQMKGDAEVRVKTSLVIEKISELESIVATDADVEAEFEEIAKSQKVELEEVKKVYSGANREYVESSLRARKTVDFLVENAKFVPAKEEVVAEEVSTEE